MALIKRFCCWSLLMASLVGLIITIVFAICAAATRVVDLFTFHFHDFEINRGFHSQWKSHAYIGMQVTDWLMLIFHLGIVAFSIWLYYLKLRKHFILTLVWTKYYIAVYIIYILLELAISIYEFSFYNRNTFRLEYVGFLFIFWLLRTLINMTMCVILWSRKLEMEATMERELKNVGERKTALLST